MAASRSPWARRIADSFSPSACRMAERLLPSAVRIAARRVRSACICFSIACWMSRGGMISLSSTLVTRMPHFSVTSSRTVRSLALISSRQVEVGDLVLGGAGVNDLVVDDGRDLHADVVVGYDRLRLEGDDLLPQVRLGQHLVHHRDHEGQPALRRPVVSTEPLHDGDPALWDDPHAARDHQKNDQRQDAKDYEAHAHDLSPSSISTASTRAVIPSLSSTRTRVPDSILCSG